ncbi:MAG: aspartate--tRNA ligase [Patescibacteria group bacterium]
MTKILTQETINKVGKKVILAGWVHFVRKVGRMIFILLRDRSGLVQVVFTPENKDLYRKAKELKSEFVISVKGKVQKRPIKDINPNLKTGEIEVLAEELEILNRAKTLPFEISKDEKKEETKEELRLKYRYLDLRREKIKENLILRYKVIKFFREWLDKKGFLEIETPYLTKGTPEGAREFVVPSRLHRGKFYVLPQAPQQFKQLLMIAGFEKYFQIARCFRDEDPRADRQPEFTQLDIEMSFVKEDDILNLIEKLFIDLVKNICPEKKISQIPFPRIKYQEVIKKYKTDKPDLRKDKKDKNELAFCFITDFPLFEYSKEEKKLVAKHNPFTKPKEEDLPLLDKNPEKVYAYQYDFICNGWELGGGALRINQRSLQEKIFKILGLSEKEIENKFSHLLEALEYGAPPHGGIAIGVERVVALLAGQENIREVIAFPKTSDAKDLMMNAPSEIDKKHLEELHLKIEER